MTIEVSKLNAYAVLNTPPGPSYAYITQIQVEVWGRGSGPLRNNVTQIQVEAFVSSTLYVPPPVVPYAMIMA